MNTRLSRSDWIDHGLRTLAADGARSLQVSPMASSLKVSRGSFYWHFRDIADFRAQVLKRWNERTTERVIESLELREAEPDRLRSLMHQAFSDTSESFSDDERQVGDDRVRAWALEEPEVAVAIAAIDLRRIVYIAELLEKAGVPSRPARSRAAFLYSAYLGHALSSSKHRTRFQKAALDDIVALFQQ